MRADPRVLVALDYPDARSARELVARLDPSLCRLKIGKELFVRAGPELVRAFIDAGYEIFLDLKFHDIPNTVAAACAAAADLGVWMVNVHASGGRRMMEAAREAIATGGTETLLIGVTVLTSMSDEDLAEIGFAGTPEENVRRLAALAQSSGLDGVVCSAREAALLKETRGREFLLVTPGIRPAGAEVGDQRRIMTPADAIRAGSDYLVIGRPITQAADPVAVLRAIEAEVRQTLDQP
ncbi:orotidine-5'-phosphate decarboxylase [Endothiovibrio diazotrophicus]